MHLSYISQKGLPKNRVALFYCQVKKFLTCQIRFQKWKCDILASFSKWKSTRQILHGGDRKSKEKVFTLILLQLRIRKFRTLKYEQNPKVSEVPIIEVFPKVSDDQFNRSPSGEQLQLW